MIVPLEIIEQIIDALYNDRATLLSLSLVCHQTLPRSRRHLFSTLDLGDNDAHFEKFLNIVDVPWTSFTRAVKRIRLRGLFNSSHYKRHTECDISRIAENLHSVGSVWLMPSYAWTIGWECIPSYVLELIFRLDIRDLQFYSITFDRPQHVVDLFNRLQQTPAVENLVIYNFKSGKIPDLKDLSMFRRPFRFSLLDSCSLQMWQHIWEPFILTNIRVESFHVRSLSSSEAHQVVSLSEFLRSVGPSIRRLRFDISDLFNVLEEKWHYLDLIDLSQCINVHALFVGIILLDDSSRTSSKMFRTMWQLLSLLPSPDHLQEVSIAFRPTHYALPIGTETKDLAAFQWLSLVDRLQRMFQSLKKINFMVGATQSEKKARVYLNAIRDGGRLGVLEEQGIVKLEIFPMPELSTLFAARWIEVAMPGIS
ncbi:hypothetical protein JOM56_011971 [Amanita muscaria]